MGAIVIDNQVFDSWLTKKSQEILSKVDRERITTEEMLILILKAQTNHFHHMDLEFREEFRGVKSELQQIDKKLEKLWDFQKWQGGILLSLFAGIYLKLFLG